MLKKGLAKYRQAQNKNKFVRQAAKGILLILLFLAVFLFAQGVLAQNINVGLEYAEQTGLGTQDIRITIAKIIRTFLGLLGIISVCIILYGGYIYMTSAGNPEKIEQAKKILRNAVIGLIIILSSFAIAQFILTYLLQASGAGTGLSGRPPYGAGGGALGNGIIESHYPERGAFNIPRNTSIVVTFKEPMDLTTLINDNGTLDETDDLINTSSIEIYKTIDEGNQPQYVTNVRASYTLDEKTFVFKPIDFLGSSDESFNYTVHLTENILKKDGSSAFGAYGDYKWGFEVSNQIDNTPPKIKSVLPRFVNSPNETVPRNHIVQINFNEPINPMTIRGIAEVVGGGTVGDLSDDTYDFIEIYTTNNQYDNLNVAGEFYYSDGYRTAEFVTNDLCGKNTCGGDVFCLPSEAFINVLVKAATLDNPSEALAVFPFDGVVDMANNSLDGNLDGKAVGPESQSGTPAYNMNFSKDPIYDTTVVGDESEWSFYTSDEIDLTPPEIETYFPEAGDIGIDPSTDYEITFDKFIMKSTIKPDSGYLDGNEYITLVQPPPDEMPIQYPAGGWAYWLRSFNTFDKTVAKIKHNILGDNLNFGINVGSGIKDLMQNCFQPCAGPQCEKIEIGPGEYEVNPAVWQPAEFAFPTCDMTGQAYTAGANIILNYLDPKGGLITTNVSAWSLDKAIEDFYEYGPDTELGYTGPRTHLDGFGGVFNTFMKANRTMSFIYHDSLSDSFYFIHIYGAPDIGAGGFVGSMTNAQDEYTFAIKDDYSADIDCSLDHTELPWGDNYADCGDTLKYSGDWITRFADGVAIYLGDSSKNDSFDINVNEFTFLGAGTEGLVNEWVFRGTQRDVLIAKDFDETQTLNIILQVE
jgi:multidrug transporter EmrE-like cation transporter